MEKMVFKFKHLVLVIVLLAMVAQTSNGAVVVTPVTNGSCLAVSPGPFTTMSNIIWDEGLAGDFAIQSGTTIILTAPAGFQFNPGVGNVVFTTGRDISSATISVTATTLTVTLTVSGNTQIDRLRIRNVQVRALATNISGNILRTGAGGTAVITGDASGAGVNHGSLSATGSGGVFTSVAAGSWSNPAIWDAGQVPGCTDQVVINHAVTADVTVSINDLTINTGGHLTSDQSVTSSNSFTITGTGIYTHNNTAVASSTIFSGTENFGPSSKMIINRWSNVAVPLANGVTGDFGEIEVNITGTWNQAGLFAPARIKNTLTINNGLFVLDNGTGMTTTLTLQDVVIGGTGRIQIQSGAARNLTLVTGNFTDASTSTALSYINFQSPGDINWTVNGDLTLSHRFTIFDGSTVGTDVGSLVVDVTGDFTINNGNFLGMNRVTGPFTMDVSGTTSITGTVGSVMFKDYYSGTTQITTGDLIINSNTNVYVLGTHSVDAEAALVVNNDMTLSGNLTRLYMAILSTNSNNISIDVGNDFTVSGAQLYTALTNGNVSVSVGRNYLQSGATSEYIGQRNTTGNASSTFSVSGSLNVTGGVFQQSRNAGNVILNVVENVNIQNSTFYGMNGTMAGNNGTASLSCVDLNISGGSFYLHRGNITDGRTIPVNISGDMSVEFTNTSQQVMFVGRASDNNAVLDMQIGSNLLVYGSADGLFCSSISEGAETIDITGDVLISAGRVRFNSYEYFTARGHAVTGNIGGSLLISGGSISLSSNRGVANWTVAGDYEQTGGYATLKWYNQGGSNLTIMGNFTLSNALLNLYSHPTLATSDAVKFSVHGNATFSNSTVMFDSCQSSTASHIMTLKGGAVTFGSNTVFDHRAHLTAIVNQGQIHYDRTGTINLNRTSSSFDIRHVKQVITSGTTVEYSASPFDLMIATHSSSVAASHTSLNVNGSLNMGTKMIVGREQPNYYALVDVASGGVLRTAHTNGLYSGTTDPSCIYPLISGSLRMNFNLDANSTVVYYGNDNQKLTGTGIGMATTASHRYGILEINFSGTPDVEYVYLSGDSAQVRNELKMTNGELNLNSNHNSNGVGQTLHMLTNSIITRTNGYIRSETYDGSARLSWMINTTGSFMVPFGRSSTEYIPFTYQPTTGNTGRAIFATNRVAANNTPFPPTVTHVRDVFGADNSAQTVDRFWRISVPGSVTANMTFTATTSEVGSIANPRAQLWEPVSQGWFPPGPTQSNPTITSTNIGGVTGLNNWWTLSQAGSPLPVELLSFEASQAGASVRLDWSTASEINNDYFTVERSRDGVEFSDVINVSGAGNSTNVNNYTTFDTDPMNGVSYYRLRQTDFDGTQSWSEIRKINISRELPVSVYPNPVISNVISIAAASETERVKSVNIYDLSGKFIQQLGLGADSGDLKVKELTLTNEITPGSYLLEITTNESVYREKIIKQ